jgi:hypothetical protein
MKFGLVVLRTILGTLFIGHGTQKLFGWFEGQGLRDTGDLHRQGTLVYRGRLGIQRRADAAVFAIAEQGPGDWSLDHALHTERSGPLWATAAVGAGAAGPVLTTPVLFLIAAAAGLPV